MSAKPGTISDAAFAHAAWMLRCDVPAIKAVAIKETGRWGAWMPDGAPVILYEPHRFHALTGGKFDRAHPTLSYPKWGARPYGMNSEQHIKLAAAAKLDRDAALKSASWGLFQIMGSNYRRAGHASLQSFIDAAYRDVDEHLRMFVHFIASDPTGELPVALRTHDWRKFKIRYNGSGENGYEVELKKIFDGLAGGI
jgi:hypothetical protein